MHLSRIIFAMLPVLGGTVAPQSTPPVVLELFTSEGCSSCPPADRVLADFAAQGSAAGVPVIALSEHVDYWNSLGWRDPFSQAAFSRRQQHYARRFRLESVYTPQLVVDGALESTANDGRRVSDAIAAAARGPRTAVSLRLSSSGSGFSVHVEASTAAPSDVLAALVTDSTISQVSRGENAGRRLVHANVVRELITVGHCRRHGCEVDFTLDAANPAVRAADSLVIVVQESGQGRITGAAAARLHSPS